MNISFRGWILAAIFVVIAAAPARAQGTLADYQRAEKFLPGNLRHQIYVADVTPHWIEKTSRFWYRKAGPSGTEFILVDATQNSSGPAFDHTKLAESLSRAAKREYTATQLPFDSIEFSKDGQFINFQLEGWAWTCALEKYECRKSSDPQPGPYEDFSPNGAWAAYVKDHNLYLRDVSTGSAQQLTRDGEAGWDYATPIPSLRPMVAQGTDDVKQRPAVFWAPGSSKLVTYRLDSRNAGHFMTLQFVPPNKLRPKAYDVVYPLPGEALPTAEPIIFDVPSGKRTDIKTAPLEIRFQGGPGFDWYPDSKGVFYDYSERGEKAIELREVDPATGMQRVLVREQSERYVDPGETFFRFAHESGEVVWSSERDGWNHLYLSNARTGQVIDQLTQGSWAVRQILFVDEKARRVYFSGCGREQDEDPYLIHVYSVGFDGKGLTLLTPENANHVASVSPDGAFFVDSYSRADLPGKAVLRRTKDGSEVRVLEETDAAELLKTGWKYPEPFLGKAADGTTDLFGLIWRPSNFDPARKYPIVEQVYTGPQGFFVPKSFGQANRSGLQAVAELGFIVVMVDGRGTTGRSRAFHEYSYRNLGGSFEDHVAMIRQMAARYPYMDIERVGIWGTSAGGYGAAHAMLVLPEFYKVGVTISGDHDARLDKAWWNELYQGYPLQEDYIAQSNVTMAGKLQGHLLVVHGDIDDNVHPVESMRFVDALMKANKNFDMLLVPNMYHGEGGNPYLIRRRWDYFVEHLLGVTPPSGFEVHEDREEPARGR